MKDEALSLSADRLEELIGAFEGYDVYCPRETDGRIAFEKYDGNGKIALDSENSAVPPKSLLLPSTETLLDYSFEDGFRVEAREEDMPDTVLFGIRNCDARAVVYLDKAMLEGDFQDVYYKRKRERIALIGLACNTPPYPDCFCTSVGGGPHCTEGLDIQIVPLGDRYLLIPLTEKGAELVEGLPDDLLREAAEAEKERGKDLGREAEDSIIRHADLDGTYEKMAANFDHPYWKKVSQPCIGCGICTFLCPTCFCFDINDVGNRKGGQRIRVWDTCQFPEYSIHASGHNPRPTKRERQRQRFYHKYKYSIDNQDMIGCVGCGRCINMCPVDIDIADVVEGVKDLKGASE